MRLERVRIDAFGAIRDLDTGEGPLPGMVVIHGPNEAGKSSFFHFLTALLYGFYPASRDGNPFAPWGGVDAGGMARLRLDDGRRIEVHRRLLSSPTGSLVRAETEEDLRNRTLPCVEHVPLAVFEQVYALTLSELAGLGGETWTRIQDRLVTGMGASDLTSVRDAAETLDREAGKLWRPNRMGNQRVRDLTARLSELRKRRPDLADQDRRLREAARRRARLEERLEAARLERESCQLFIERYRALLPVRDQLRRMEALEEEAGPPDDLEGLPAEPGRHLAELREELTEIDERIHELNVDAEEPRARADAFGPDDRALLDREARIRELAGRAAGQESVHVRVGQLEQEIRDLERRAEVAAKELFDVSWEELDRDAARRMATSELRTAVATYRDAREERRVTEEAARSARPREEDPGWAPAWLGPGLATVGGGLGAVGWIVDSTALAVTGALVLGVGAALVAAHFARGRSDPRAEAVRNRVAEAGQAERRARVRIAEQLDGLPFRDEVVNDPPADLPGRVERLQDLLRDVADRRDTLASHRRDLAGVERALTELATDLGKELPPGRPGVVAEELGRRLREAERRRDAAREAERALKRLDREAERLAERRDRVERERTVLTGALEALGDGDLDAGIEEAVRRRRAGERARQLREELEQGHHDLNEIRERIRQAEDRGEDWVVDDEALTRRRAREGELTREIEELRGDLEGVRKDMDYLSDGPTLDGLDSEIAALEARRDRAVRESDRLRVLAAVLREADRRFRETHQPDIIRRAGEHLDTVTGGRYRRLLVDEAGEGAFRLHGDHLPGPVEVGEPISTGTREQVYLALRLAMVDHLDEGGERLPLFMDEAFVNWDRSRRRRGFDLLDDVSRTRQVFVFTCHDAMAGELRERGARAIELPAPRPVTEFP